LDTEDGTDEDRTSSAPKPIPLGRGLGIYGVTILSMKHYFREKFGMFVSIVSECTFVPQDSYTMTIIRIYVTHCSKTNCLHTSLSYQFLRLDSNPCPSASPCQNLLQEYFHSPQE
jgi:hypothetical protein